MLGRVRLVAVFVAAALLASVSRPASRAADTGSEPQAILVKAWNQIDIRAPGSGPFILKATVRLIDGDKSTGGVYAMSWAAPDRFRRVMGFRDYVQTDVARGENYYSKRNTDGVPVIVWRLGELMDSFAVWGKKLPEVKVKRVETQIVEGRHETCVLASAEAGDSRICVNAETIEAVSIETGLDEPAQFREQFEYSKYQPFETKTYPRRFAYSGRNKRSIEVRIDKLVAVREFAADEFSPPAGSEISSYCNGTEEMTGEFTSALGNELPVSFNNMDADIYFEIGPTGFTRSGQVVYSSDPSKDKAMLAWFFGGHFPQKTCDGRPIAYQMMYPLGAQHPLWIHPHSSFTPWTH
jgi:hypothetical protein